MQMQCAWECALEPFITVNCITTNFVWIFLFCRPLHTLCCLNKSEAGATANLACKLIHLSILQAAVKIIDPKFTAGN